MFKLLREDIQCVKERDPAAQSSLEIFFLYPGLKAIRLHRKAYWCYNHKLFFISSQKGFTFLPSPSPIAASNRFSKYTSISPLVLLNCLNDGYVIISYLYSTKGIEV